MSFTVSFIERRDPETSSLERVFRSVGEILSERGLNIRYDKVPYGNSIRGMVANLFARRPKGADIYHVTGHIHYYALLLPAKKTVLTVHDLQILNVRKGIRRYLIKKLFYDLPVKKLRYITVISEQTKRELVKATNCPHERVVVIENPVTIGTLPGKKPFDKNCPTILHIGTAPHKNLHNLIGAIDQIRCRLKIIGPLDKVTLEMLRESHIDFENLVHISDAEITDEYLNSDLVSFCSTAEGFGLPILEAQALAIPLVTSDLSPMKEVAGEGAILVNPHDPLSIRNGISEIIANDDARAKIIEKGMQNIRRFSPERIAGEYQKLYATIIENNRDSRH